jgi:hypothetical protein
MSPSGLNQVEVQQTNRKVKYVRTCNGLYRAKMAQDLISSRFVVVKSNVIYELNLVREFHVVGSSSLMFSLGHDIRDDDVDGLPIVGPADFDFCNEYGEELVIDKAKLVPDCGTFKLFMKE